MDNKFYYCYSCRLKDFLKSQGLRFITKGLHVKSGRPFFIFEKSKELDKYLEKWLSIREY